MNPETLLTHFDRIADAPDAIPRLRRFILDLAVRGKLVPQDLNDEPAADLLKRIQAEKRQLVKVGKIKESKFQITACTDNSLYDIPTNWKWVSLGETINSHLGGGTPSKNNLSYWNGDIYWASVKDVGKNKYINETIDCITQAGLTDSSSNLIPPGNLIVVTRMGLGKISINRVPIAINQDLRALSMSSLDNIDYFYIFFKTCGFEGSGMTVKGIKVEELLSISFPLPPLAEQHRIAAKVDELMALCDRLEAAQAEREHRRERLAAASLQRLNQPDDAPAFHENARFHLHHLPRLTTRPEQIPQLRQTILNLAVRGKLVPQDPNDEPASELLKKIKVENRQLLRETGGKEKEARGMNATFDEPFNIPGSWQWVYLGDIASGFRYGTSVKCSYEPVGNPVLRIPNIQNGHINIEDLKFGILPERESDDLRLQMGDILMVRSNGSLNLVGRPALVEAQTVGFCYAGYLVRIRTSRIYLDTRYLLLTLISTHVRDQIEIPIRTTVGLKNINSTEMSGLTLPLPPLAEQQRIVARVDELMALCDRLEAQLTTTQTESRRLLDAVLHEALAPAASKSTGL